jgi:hypothetical protein
MFGMYLDPPTSANMVKPAQGILQCSLETRIIAVLVTGEKRFTVS